MEIGLFGSAISASTFDYPTIPVSVLAQEAEVRGFDAIFVGEHSHTPVGATLPKWMGAVGGQPFPEWYRHYPDPFVILSQASALTTRIKIGVAVCVVAIHDPISLSKSVSTLDHVSGGRLIFGVGYGYSEGEFRNHGVDRSKRRDIVREKMLAMERLWDHETASFEGDYVSFTESWMYPKPIQKPRPPVLIGGQLTATTLDDIVEWGDGWLPANMMTKGNLATQISILRDRFAAAGRQLDGPDITVFHTVDHLTDRGWDYRAGAAPITDDLLERYENMGVTRLCLPIPNEPTAKVLQLLDRYVHSIGERLSSI